MSCPEDKFNGVTSFSHTSLSSCEEKEWLNMYEWAPWRPRMCNWIRTLQTHGVGQYRACVILRDFFCKSCDTRTCACVIQCYVYMCTCACVIYVRVLCVHVHMCVCYTCARVMCTCLRVHMCVCYVYQKEGYGIQDNRINVTEIWQCTEIVTQGWMEGNRVWGQCRDCVITRRGQYGATLLWAR